MTDETPREEAFSAEEDLRPVQFEKVSASLHAERERTKSLAQDWQPSSFRDLRDLRSPQLLGENLLRMPASLGSLAMRHDLIEVVR